MTPTEKGSEAERRFFLALGTRVEETPSWFLRVKQASASLDIRGVDALAFIYPHNDPTPHDPTQVPLQIKSSTTGRDHYYQTMPTLQAHNVVVIIVTAGMTEQEIRLATYDALRPVQESGKRFGFFYKGIMAQNIRRKNYERLHSLVARIKRKAESV